MRNKFKGSGGVKVYSWKILIITLIFFIIAMTYYIKDLMAGDSSAIASILLWIYFLIRGLWVTLNEDGFANNKVNEDIYKQVVKKLFGKWSFIATSGGLILIVFASILSKILPSQKWIAILLFIIGILYHIAVSILVSKHIKAERRKYLL